MFWKQLAIIYPIFIIFAHTDCKQNHPLMHIHHELISHLPALSIADEVNHRLLEGNKLVITAPPGAGKSTLLPLTILQETEGKILMLEPRRLAARTVAERMAEILGERVGETVGYRIRFENNVSAKTRIEVLTEGILTRMLVSDPMLEGVSVVIFDEFHERSMASDLALALTREAQEVVRPDLRIILMSATIDAQAICENLQAPLIESEGRMFPVDIRHQERVEESTMPDVVARDVACTILQAHREEEGDILAFLPGQAEIMRCQDLLGKDMEHTHIYPLYGLLSAEEQHRAIEPSPTGERKIVLATNIAETSLTIEGVRIVVDSGLQRTMVYDQKTELSHLETVPISLDMANQRTGRAGRVTDGICYRLWSNVSEHRMTECRTPELVDADLSSLVLDVAAWGEPDPSRLPWLTPPPSDHLKRAIQLLRLLGAIDQQGKITPMGQQMAGMACHPRIARMLLQAQTDEEKALAADIAALMEEKDPMASNKGDDMANTDINLRITMLREARRKHQEGRLSRLLHISEEYRRSIHAKEDNTCPDPEQTGKLLALAYPERVACAIDRSGNYRMANGTHVKVSLSDEVSSHTWIAIASLNAASGKVFLASPIAKKDLLAMAQKMNRLSWDNKNGTLVSQEEQRIGVLVVDSKPLQPSREELVQALCIAAQDYGESMLDFNDKVQQLQNRVALVRTWHPELELPELDTTAVLKRTTDWLPFYLENNGRIRTNVSELKHINVAEAMWSLLSYEQQLAVEELAPSHIVVPTGSRIHIDYRQGAEAPILSVRLQECFGLTDTPRVNHDTIPVLMELLSPGFKPVQLTKDLKSFWSGTYFEVRKELKRRYPKHYWPDNPLEADPTRGVKRK